MCPRKRVNSRWKVNFSALEFARWEVPTLAPETKTMYLRRFIGMR